MPKQVLITIAADFDLIHIANYTIDEWGKDQCKKYQNLLKKRIQSLIVYPEQGRKHEDLHSRFKYVIEEKHYIFYEIQNENIVILRIVHERSDIVSELFDY